MLTPRSFVGADRISQLEPSIFGEITALAIQHKAANLGQGFPDFEAPQFVTEAAKQAISQGLNQYTRPGGHPRLVQALSRFYSPLFQRELDPLRHIITTVGATQGLFLAILSLVNPGEEVLLMEPFYDSYPANVLMAGGVPVYVPLRPAQRAAGEWRLDLEELRSKVRPGKTRMLIVNNPANVPGKRWSRKELEGLADIAKQNDLIVLSDEVYEWMVYDGVEHVRIATLPGMFDRTITFGSAGKSFSVTGWKVGWAIGPTPLISAMNTMYQYNTFSHSTPLQEAVAVAFENAEREGYFPWLKDMFQRKRDKLVTTLNNCGLTPVVPQGSYFVLADTSKVKDSSLRGASASLEDEQRRDLLFCKWLIKEKGVAAIPPSSFYSKAHRHIVKDFARFAFCKKDEVLELAAQRLQNL
ncbi:arylformamidase, variant 2 [Balamuthia mandrillaris]